MRRIAPRALHPAAAAAAAPARRWQTDAQTIRSPFKLEQFVRTTNQKYLEDLYKLYKKDRALVDRSWHSIFERLPSAGPDEPLVTTMRRPADAAGTGKLSPVDQQRIDNLKLAWIARSFEQKGHLTAQLDPLGMFEADLSDRMPQEMLPSFFGLGADDLMKVFKIKADTSVVGGVTDGDQETTLGELENVLKRIYCGPIGYEFMHLRNVEEQVFIRERLFRHQKPRFSDEQILRMLVQAEQFEGLLRVKYQTAKRFGGEGGEALIPLLHCVLDCAAEDGVSTTMFGMAHRGRLSICHNVLGKPLDQILNEFKGICREGDTDIHGDVKYHVGVDQTVKTECGKDMRVRLLPNPSHLEAVNPLVMGAVRAHNDAGESRAMAVLLHGDAAFAGQGICFEGMAMGELSNYSTEGTVHIIINNQVGFTTNPADSRSAAYCSDLAKLNNVPVFHVNADNPTNVVRCAQLAMQFRNRFHRDVLIDLVCYRRNGHNETDQPRFTQPLMYKKIDKHPSVGTIFSEKLAREGRMSADHIKTLTTAVEQDYRRKFNEWEADKGNRPKGYFHHPPRAYADTPERAAARKTGVPVARLQALGKTLTSVPQGFQMHKLVAAVIEKRAKSIAEGHEVEWGAAEQLALGSLLEDGVPFRIAGQDVERGTFSHRHYNLHDFNDASTFCSLTDLAKKLETQRGTRLPATVCNSLLSEYAACGFEMGYALENQKSLVIWEAQFGDFANGAQIIFDTFLNASEAKWGLTCSLGISLPHGWDGQGPEHSSARLERFLQLSCDPSDDSVPADFGGEPGEDPLHVAERRAFRANWQVCTPSTPANFFHMLRRQVKRDFNRPIVYCVSKQSLRNVGSELAEFGEGTTFQPVLGLPNQPAKPRRVVLCNGGNMRITVTKEKAAGKGADVAFVFIDQLCPFPWEQVAEHLGPLLAANPQAEVVWAQEEPRNMGAWQWARPRLESLLAKLGRADDTVRYVGRKAAASPATGYGWQHNKEVADLLKGMFA